MSKPNRPGPFTFAEIMVAAPWAASILSNNRDNDKGVMLQCNTTDDEWSFDASRLERAAIEREAREERARVMGEALKRLGARLAAGLRRLFVPRAHPRAQH